jgi:hypothetical protein
MELVKLLSTIDSSKIKVKEVAEAIENLNINNVDLSSFLSNNKNITVTEYDVTSFLMNTATKLIEKRIPLTLVKNVYEQYSVIFAINTLNVVTSVSERKKATNIFIDVLSNSAKFDIFAKVVKNTKLVSSASSIVNELFWLTPLFSNTKVLTSVDYNKFIVEMKEISTKNNEFVLGYSYFVTSDVKTMDKNNYKQFLADGLKTK